jgi:hypothetical protein
MLWLTGKWSRMYRIMAEIEEEQWYDDTTVTGKGVYRLIGLRENGAPAPISRVCGIDSTGTLYIGAADRGNLDGRLGSLVSTHRPDHKSGDHIPLLPKLAERFPPQRLAVVWECTDQPYKREEELKDAYKAEFGERPPHDGQ